MNINLKKRTHLVINGTFDNASDAIESLGYTEIKNHEQGGQKFNAYKNNETGKVVVYRSMENEGRFIQRVTVSPEVVAHDKEK